MKESKEEKINKYIKQNCKDGLRFDDIFSQDYGKPDSFREAITKKQNVFYTTLARFNKKDRACGVVEINKFDKRKKTWGTSHKYFHYQYNLLSHQVEKDVIDLGIYFDPSKVDMEVFSNIVVLGAEDYDELGAYLHKIGNEQERLSSSQEEDEEQGQEF